MTTITGMKILMVLGASTDVTGVTVTTTVPSTGLVTKSISYLAFCNLEFFAFILSWLGVHGNDGAVLDLPRGNRMFFLLKVNI